MRLKSRPLMVILALSRSFINFSHAEARLASTAMAMSVARNGLRALLRGGVRRSDAVAGKRSFSASAHQDDVVEMEKWEKITYVGIITYTVLSIYNLSRDHPHHPGAPPFEYLHVRHKGFRWEWSVLRPRGGMAGFAFASAYVKYCLLWLCLWASVDLDYLEPYGFVL